MSLHALGVADSRITSPRRSASPARASPRRADARPYASPRRAGVPDAGRRGSPRPADHERDRDRGYGRDRERDRTLSREPERQRDGRDRDQHREPSPKKVRVEEPEPELQPVEEEEDLEKKLEEKRRRREAILAKYRAGEGAKPPLSAVTSASVSPSAAAQALPGSGAESVVSNGLNTESGKSARNTSLMEADGRRDAFAQGAGDTIRHWCAHLSADARLWCRNTARQRAVSSQHANGQGL